MSLKAADDGLKKKLEDIYPNVIFSPLDRALEVSADSGDNRILQDGTISKVADYSLEQEGKTNGEAVLSVPYTYKGQDINRASSQVVKLPLIAFDRLSNPYSEYDIVDQVHRTGLFWTDEVSREKSFSADLEYQIDIVSDRRVDVDEIWRELTIVLMVNNSVRVVYNTEEEEIIEDYPIEITGTEFGRDVMSFFDNGIMYRQTITLKMLNVRMLFTKKLHLIQEVPLRLVNLKEE